MTSNSRRWASRHWILEQFGMPIRAFDRAVVDGHIRSVKFGETRQAARVFLIRDCERFMLKLAAGRQLLKKSDDHS